jgi:hypothetical protein
MMGQGHDSAPGLLDESTQGLDIMLLKHLPCSDCCANLGAGPTSRRGSHIYKINTWLWNFGLPQPSVGCLSAAKTEKILRKSLSKASKRA